MAERTLAALTLAWPVLASLDTGRATNGGTGSINGLIELHRRIACGIRNRDHYRLRMLLIGDGLTSPHLK